jgi:hypothetical protein
MTFFLKFNKPLISLLILLGLMMTSVSPMADDGILNAVAFRPIPSGAAIAVQPWDNSDENMKTARIIETHLQNQGYKIVKSAKLTLSFETRNALGKWTSGSNSKPVEFKAERGSSSGNDAEVRLNLFSSSEGGLFNPTKKPGENVLSKINLEITLDQRNGPRLWQGNAVTDVNQTDGASVARRLTPLLLNHLGKTIRRKTVEIP